MDDSCNVFIGTKDNYDADNYTWHFDFSANMATIYNVVAGKYLYPDSNGNIISSASATDAKWRFCETSEFVPLESFTVVEIVMEVGETATPTITPVPANATWVNENDFTFEFESSKIAISGFKVLSLAREHTTINIAHNPSGYVTTSDVFVKNAVLSETEKQSLIAKFELEFGNVCFSPIHVKYLLDALQETMEYDYTITRYCNIYKIPKEFVQTVLLREIWCYKPDDALADELVKEYYDWKHHGGLEPVVKHTDSSTGIAQIFAATAIKALNNADTRGFIDLTEKFDEENWEDMWAVWISMHESNEISIRNCALVILNCQYEFSADIPEEDFYNYSPAQIKRILSRYNGPEYLKDGNFNEDAKKYGDDCYEFFEIFKNYN